MVVSGGSAVVTSATGGGVFCVQPARKTAAMQTRRSSIVFLSILKISRNNDKPDGDYKNFTGKRGSVEIIGFYHRPLLGATASDASAPAARASPTQG
jgi:hypothetical protein